MTLIVRLTCLVCFMSALAGCSTDSTNVSVVPTSNVGAAAFNVTGAPTVAFSVPDMMCPEGCGVKVKEILSEQPGAKDVIVDFDSKTATVAVDPGQFDSTAAVAALVDHQFNHSTLKREGTAVDGTKPQAAEAATVQ